MPTVYHKDLSSVYSFGGSYLLIISLMNRYILLPLSVSSGSGREAKLAGAITKGYEN